MKIALVYDVICPYVKGGAERRFYEIGKRLARNNEVHFFGMKLWKGQDVVFKQNVYLHGVCESQELYTGKKGQRSIREALYFAFKLFKPLLKQDFDLVDCSAFPYFSLFTCKLIRILKRKKMIGTWHEVWGKDYWIKYLGPKGIFGYSTEKLSILMPDRIISVSETTTNKLKNDLNSKKKIYTIPNGIDFNKIQKIKPAKEESDIIFTGRLLEHKNVDFLIKSIKTIKEKNPNIKCLIIGEGPEREKLKNLTKKLKLEKNIKFLGFQKRSEDVYSLMKSSKIFILPSAREGFGIVVVEANACGIPVITVEHKDNASKDLIEEGENGFICNLDEKDIANSTFKILKQNPNKKMKQACINSAKKYDWGKIVKQVEGVYGG